MGLLAPGTMLGGCRIEAVVGRGGMGVVYRAHQLDLERDVALKVIAPELVEDPETRRRFLSEARAAGAVEHPNVVPVHGAGVAEDRAYLVMRYVQGHHLRAVVGREGPLPPSEAARILGHLGDALDAIHHAGYVHRDVKPQNVLLDEMGHVYLSDFGLAKQALATAGPTGSDEWVGTVDYVAPEQIRGEAVDARTDVYSLGGVLHFMLTGKVPFDRPGNQAKLWAHLAQEPPRVSDVRPELSPAWDAVLARALAKAPADRYPSAGDLARAARAAAGGEAPPTGNEERTVARGQAAPTRHEAATYVAASAASTVTSPGRTRVLPRPRRRRLAALAVVVVGAVAFTVAIRGPGGGSGDEDSGGGRQAAADRADVADEAGAAPRVGPTIKNVGFRPRDLTVAGGSVWVISVTRRHVTRIHAGSGRRTGRQPLVGRGAWSIARDGRALWVAMRPQSRILRVDARSGRVVRGVTTPIRPYRVAAGPSGLWVVCRAGDTTGEDVILHYDRDGRVLREQLSVPAGVRAITLGHGRVWLALEREPRIARIVPGGKVERHAVLTGPARALTFGAGHLWASVTDGDEIARVDPRTGLVLTTSAGQRPAQLAVAAHRVFVASNTDHTVVMLDPATNRPTGRPLEVPPNPYAVAEGAGHVWVTGVGENTLTRLDY
jgi:DNA-binding beta-propeller fold protein YncE